VLITADRVAQGKPDPEGYLAAAAALGLTAESCIVVEDAPAGVEAARRAGMRCIAITSTHPADELHDATVVVRELRDIEVSDLRSGTMLVTAAH
jgi:mannitol-1-/sugar-/sorbitol-6-phosphatase